MKIIVAAIVVLSSFVVSIAVAQHTETPNSSEILLRMKKLSVLGSVLYIAAHPDDENTRLLTWLSKERLYRTGYLSLTRGDGGQNLIGDEQGFELGLIRTQELLAARRIDGAEQFFSRAFDFGFSKTTAEALQLWNKEKILSDVVWVIRKFKPDVIITRFPEDGRAGHGHHSASSVLAHEAFVAAADPNRFPEQLTYGVKPWQATRIFWNTYNFGNVNTTAKDQLKIEVGGFNPLLGKSYGELAAEGRSQHKSQGFGVPHSRGASYEYFALTAGKPFESDLMDGVDCSWHSIAHGDKIASMIQQMITQYNPALPEQSVAELLAIHKGISVLPDGYWRTKKMAEVQELIEACTGLFLEATVQNGYAVQGQPLSVTCDLVNRSSIAVSIERTVLNGHDSVKHAVLPKNEAEQLLLHTIISDNQPVSQPYWLVNPMSTGSFNVNEQQLIGDPQNKPALEVVFSLTIGGQSFSFPKPVYYKYTSDVKGEVYEPLTILPPVTAYCDPALLIFAGNTRSSIEVHTQKRVPSSPLPKLSLTKSAAFNISEDDTVNAGTFFFHAQPTVSHQDVQHVQVVAEQRGKADSLFQLRTISYEHIPRIDYFRPAQATFVLANLHTSGKRIGYIEGAGDKVPVALRQMGYEVTAITQKEMSSAYLKTFDAILTGVRAYDVHDWLFDSYDMLMKYVADGGNLIVQYNRNDLGNYSSRMGPYPFSIATTRVTDEHAPVEFVQANHPVLNYPNKITVQDFEGWIQERGIYFASKTDDRYEKIFSMHDPGETKQEGSLIIAHYGKGTFSYTGLVFFRELPAGIAGAYRLLANLIALNQPVKP